MSYKRVTPNDLVVGKSYYIVPTARLITNNIKKDVESIPEAKKKRFLFPEGKLENMLGVPEGSSYRLERAKMYPGINMYSLLRYDTYMPECAFTGLNSHGKPLVNSVKNFIPGDSVRNSGYVFFSTELTA